MKRISVTLDETLLERAREALGEKTYSATIGKALASIVKNEEFWKAYEKYEKEVKKGDFFWPGYLEEIRPNSASVLAKKKKRISAHEARAPRKPSGRGRSR